MAGLLVSAVICLLLAPLFLLCWLRGRGKYDDYLEYVDAEEYGLKEFIPAGLVFCEWNLGERFLPLGVRSMLARHSNQVYQQILELRGPKNAAFYRYIHNGYRIAAAMLAAAGLSVFGLILSAQGSSDGLTISLAAVAALFAVPWLVDSGLKTEIEKRRLSIQMEFPEFVNKLTLLVNAGMTISRAWAKIIQETKREHVLYDEMRYALGEIQAGKPEAVAYEEFARRCHVKEVTKFVSVIVMNLRRGGAEVVPVLRAQGDECWEMRKNAARALGEQAGTKILLPMMIMFLGIVLIVATPAVLSMTSGM